MPGLEVDVRMPSESKSAWFAAKLAVAFPGASSGEGVCLVRTGQSPAFAVISGSSHSAASVQLPAKCLSLYGDGVWYRLLDRQMFAWAAVKVDRLQDQAFPEDYEAAKDALLAVGRRAADLGQLGSWAADPARWPVRRRCRYFTRLA